MPRINGTPTEELSFALRAGRPPAQKPSGFILALAADRLDAIEAERDALLGDLRMIAETTPHKQGCDESDDSFCARCFADSALARAEAGK